MQVAVQDLLVAANVIEKGNTAEHKIKYGESISATVVIGVATVGLVATVVVVADLAREWYNMAVKDT